MMFMSVVFSRALFLPVPDHRERSKIKLPGGDEEDRFWFMWYRMDLKNEEDKKDETPDESGKVDGYGCL
jgi:hypothetical protein